MIYYSLKITAFSFSLSLFRSRYEELINTMERIFCPFHECKSDANSALYSGINQFYSAAYVVKFVDINLAIYRLDGWICYLRYLQRHECDENNGNRNCIFCIDIKSLSTASGDIIKQCRLFSILRSDVIISYTLKYIVITSYLMRK